MNFVQALIVGLIQGVSEWLPVSSEAIITLVLTQGMGVSPVSALNASVFLHLGTMFAALVYFREDYLDILSYSLNALKSSDSISDLNQSLLSGEAGKLLVFLVFSTMLTGIFGGLIYFTGLKAALKNPKIFYLLMSLALFLTGVLRLYKGSESRNIDSLSLFDTILSGALQGLSIIPGVSRSGTTSFVFLFRGYSAKTAFKLSFLMSVPAILAGNIGLELFGSFQFEPIYLVSTLVAGITGYLTVDYMLDLAGRAEIAWVCFGLSIIAIIPVII